MGNHFTTILLGMGRIITLSLYRSKSISLKKSGIKNIVFLLWWMLIISPAWGQEGYQVYDIRFEGRDTIPEEVLLDQMNTGQAGLLQKMAFWQKKPRFSDTMFGNDLERLRRFHQRHGFLDPRVRHRLEKDERKERLWIFIDIEEGEPVRVRSIKYDLPRDTLHADQPSLNKEEALVDEGMRFVDKKIFQEEKRIEVLFQNHGYPNVDVKRVLEVDQSEQAVDVLFRIQPGPRARFGEVSIHGDSLVSSDFIRRRLTFSPGDIYVQDKLDATQNRLFNTDLFRYVVIRTRKDSISDQRIPVHLEVSESPPWSVETGVGYGTEDRFRASVHLTKLQFFGGNRKLIFTGKHSHFLPFSLETRFIQPSILDDKVDLLVSPFFIRENEISYEVDRLGGNLTLSEDFSPQTSGYLMYSLERVFLQDLSVPGALEERKIRNKAGFTLGFDRNTADSRFNPSSGWHFNGHFTYMGIGFRSKFHYYKGEMGLIRYHRLADEWIVAGKLRAGFIEPLRGEASPIEDRFLLGGASSLRGFQRHSISPLNEENRPVGGNSMFEGSLELRFPVYDIFSGVLFTDVGNVWRGAFSYHPSDLRYNAGFGVRVKTPVGPVRLDLATPVFEGPADLQFYVSIGHAF